MALKDLLDKLKIRFQKIKTKWLIGKGVKHAVTVSMGLITAFLAKDGVAHLLAATGITVDTTALTQYLTVLFTGIAGSLINGSQKVMGTNPDCPTDARPVTESKK